MRVNNWFADSRLPFVTAVRFFYCWAKDLTSIKWCEEQLDMADKTTIDWNSYMREAVAEYLIQQLPQQKIGGKDMIVEIDESMFTKRKSNAYGDRQSGETRSTVALHVTIWSRIWLNSCGGSMLPVLMSLSHFWKQLRRYGLRNYKCNVIFLF